MLMYFLGMFFDPGLEIIYWSGLNIQTSKRLLEFGDQVQMGCLCSMLFVYISALFGRVA